MIRLKLATFLLAAAASIAAGVNAHHARRITSAESAAVLGAPRTGVGRTNRRGSLAAEPALRSSALPRRDVEAIRRRIREGEPGTYIGEILLDHDSALARWPDRSAKPLKVWVQYDAAIPDWRPDFVIQVLDAFAEWDSVGIPVRFSFVPDSASADVHVTWTDHFDEAISGKTLWARDERWWIVDGDIIIAVHHNEGEPLDTSAVKAIALHEIGHLVGLDHTGDTSNIMTSKVRVRALSPADRATARLLYTLPPGSVR
jgi:hypothetical protein